MAGFHARRSDLSVEGYVWGNLTQKPLLQPLWLLLLPFTLVNVAGWMHPPRGRFRHGGSSVFFLFRLTVRVIGIGLTTIYVFWGGTMLMNLVYNWDRDRWSSSPDTRILIGGALMVLLVLFAAVVAGFRQTKFERYPAPSAVTDLAGSDDASSGKDRSLRDPKYWSHSGQAVVLLVLHIAVAIGCVAWMVLAARAHAPRVLPVNTPVTDLDLIRFPEWATRIELLALLAFFPLQYLLWRRPTGFWRSPRTHVGFRWVGPAVAATTGVSLATELFYGLNFKTYPDDHDFQALGVAFGLGTLALIGAVLIFGVWLWICRRIEIRSSLDCRDEQHVRSNNPPVGVASEQPVGVTDPMRKRMGLGRASSEAGRNGDLLLFAPMPVFLTTAIWQLTFGSPWSLEWVERIGGVVSSVGAITILGFLIYRSRKPGGRKIVGTMWDVLTFWPRRFHPFGVRPYAERAVPELQRRLLFHVAGPRPPEDGDKRKQHDPRRRVVLSCHSQGTVLGYAALVQLPPEVVSQIAFVTYGSPLRQLHQMAFPAYFSQEGYQHLRTALWPAGDTDVRSWKSFFRRTDYIGKRVFEQAEIDQVVPDPAEEPALPTTSTGPAPANFDYPDPPRTVWADLARHSFYNEELLLKRWIRILKKAMR
jgi:hypothetical protein